MLFFCRKNYIVQHTSSKKNYQKCYLKYKQVAHNKKTLKIRSYIVCANEIINYKPTAIKLQLYHE